MGFMSQNGNTLAKCAWSLSWSCSMTQFCPVGKKEKKGEEFVSTMAGLCIGVLHTLVRDNSANKLNGCSSRG